MNTPNQPQTAQPVVAAAIPWYQSPVQIAQVVAFITGGAAYFPHSQIVKNLNLMDNATVNGYVTDIAGCIALLALLFGMVMRAFSNVQRLKLTTSAAAASTSTQAVIHVQALMKAANIPTSAETKKVLDAKSNGSSTPPAAVFFLFAILPAAMAFMGSGCASQTAATSGQTFEQILTTAAGADDVALKTIGNLAASHILTSAQATAAVKITDAIHSALNLAQVSYAAGDQATAAAKIAAAAAALAQVQVCIATGATVPVATCLAGVTSP